MGDALNAVLLLRFSGFGFNPKKFELGLRLALQFEQVDLLLRLAEPNKLP